MKHHHTLALLTVFAACLASIGCSDRGSSATTPAPSPDPSVVAVGQDIDTALNQMAPYGDGGPLIAMVTRDPTLKLKQWPVGDGVLSATYSTQTNTITSLDFHLSDERAKAERMEWVFPVTRFDPVTGEMQLMLPVTKSDGR